MNTFKNNNRWIKPEVPLQWEGTHHSAQKSHFCLWTVFTSLAGLVCLWSQVISNKNTHLSCFRKQLEKGSSVSFPYSSTVCTFCAIIKTCNLVKFVQPKTVCLTNFMPRIPNYNKHQHYNILTLKSWNKVRTENCSHSYGMQKINSQSLNSRLKEPKKLQGRNHLETGVKEGASFIRNRRDLLKQSTIRENWLENPTGLNEVRFFFFFLSFLNLYHLYNCCLAEG